MVVHPKIHNFSAFLIRIPADFVVKIDKLILKSRGKARNSRKPNCHEKEQSRRTHTSQFQNRQQGSSNQDRDACTGMGMDEWNRTENPDGKILLLKEIIAKLLIMRYRKYIVYFSFLNYLLV